MDRDEIVSKVKGLGFPAGSYIVFGSCPMAAVGIREAGDIDMLVSDEVFGRLTAEGWTVLDKDQNDKPLVSGVFEAHNNWNFSSYKPTLEHLLSTAMIIDGVPFASIDEVKKWKQSSGRPKDLTDIKLIETYQANNQ